MAGVFTENHPDFSWLMPYEEKSFVQYFFPYRELGVVKNASRDLVLNLTPRDNAVQIQVYATSRQSHTIRLNTTEGTVLFDEKLRWLLKRFLIGTSTSTLLLSCWFLKSDAFLVEQLGLIMRISRHRRKRFCYPRRLTLASNCIL